LIIELGKDTNLMTIWQKKNEFHPKKPNSNGMNLAFVLLNLG
jgi:hypothetical protein